MRTLCGFLCGLSILLIGCEPNPNEGEREVYAAPARQAEGGTPRFRVETCGRFKAGYENAEREILIITDTYSERKYLGITGVGITELQQEVKTDVEANGQVTTTVNTKER